MQKRTYENVHITTMRNLELNVTVTACQLEELTSDEQQLVKKAIEATERSYAPYSHFHVGAAARLDNGVVVCGSNQENVAYPSGTCAERTTLFYAGAQYPEVPVRMLAIAARGTEGELTEEPVSPCGACRQVMLETETRAGHELRTLLYGKRCIYVIDGVRNLLPLSFKEF